MKKRTKISKALDKKHFGDEPDLRGNVENIDVAKAYNWYSYNCDSDQAKAWVIEYLKEFHKQDKELIKNANRIDANYCRTSGWTCRILLLGGNISEDLRERTEAKIRTLAATAARASVREAEAPAKEEVVRPVISIQERVANRANDLIVVLRAVDQGIDDRVKEGISGCHCLPFAQIVMRYLGQLVSPVCCVPDFSPVSTVCTCATLIA